MKLIYLKSALKFDSFDVTIGIKIAFFRVSVTIEPGRSLLHFVTTNCLINLQSQSANVQNRDACQAKIYYKMEDTQFLGELDKIISIKFLATLAGVNKIPNKATCFP